MPVSERARMVVGQWVELGEGEVSERGLGKVGAFVEGGLSEKKACD